MQDFNAFFYEKSEILDEKFVKYEQINMLDVKTGVYQTSPQEINHTTTFTYSVIFEESDVTWASRWDHYLYLETDNSDVHWLSIINSFAMVLFLTGMVAHILRRTVNNAVNQYNERADLEVTEESGWKQINGQVFRPPKYPGIFSIIIGSGIQVIGMSLLTIIFACLGFLSPAYRGSLLTAMILLYVFMGIWAGYYSAKVYKMFGGEQWQRNTIGTALLFPSIAFSVFFVVNMFYAAEESSGAVSISTFLTILLLWFGISVPLVFLGSSLGFKKDKITFPCRVAKLERKVANPVTWRMNLICFLAGSLPFGCMFIEISYLMQSIWHHSMFYYLFGFLLLCIIVLIITSAEVSILMCYIILSREDYRWWWYSVGVAGSSGFYFFIYSMIYCFTQLHMTRLSSYVLYFGYMIIATSAFSLVTATVGFVATFVFVRKIYGMIKVD